MVEKSVFIQWFWVGAAFILARVVLYAHILHIEYLALTRKYY